MENQIQLFTNELFGNVRCMLDEYSNPWFVGIDVARALGYTDTDQALRKHVDSEDKIITRRFDGLPGNPNILMVNESGLYSLIFGSKLPAAKQFKHWVTSVVLPSMRKIGFDRSIQVLQEEVMRLKGLETSYAQNNLESSMREIDLSAMRGQMIEKIRSTPDGTPMSPELRQYLIKFDENWEG